jgi:L-ascorbate metabolism protein UlaG (beta-lactamase superfamily)
LGDIGEKITPMLAELIGAINILLVPVGGKYTIDADEAKEYVDYLMPDVVIPMHYMHEDYLTDVDDIDIFLKKFNKNDIEYVESDEIEFDRAEFDGDRTRVIVLQGPRR